MYIYYSNSEEENVDTTKQGELAGVTQKMAELQQRYTRISNPFYFSLAHVIFKLID